MNKHPKIFPDLRLDRLTWICLFTLAFLVGLDVATTEYVLLSGGVELNPFMMRFVELPLLHLAIKMGYMILAIAIAAAGQLQHRSGGAVLSAGCVAVYGVVILNNFSVILL